MLGVHYQEKSRIAEPAVSSYLERLSPLSTRSVSKLLDVAASALNGTTTTWKEFDWAALRSGDIARLAKILSERYSVSTINSILTAVRGVFREACRQKLVPAEDYFAAMEIAGPYVSRKKMSAELKPEDFKALIEGGPRRGPVDCRDEAMLALLYGFDFNSSVLVGLDLADLNLEEGVIRVAHGNQAGVYVIGPITGRVRQWLDERGDWPGPLFCRSNKPPEESRLSPQVVHDVLAARARLANLKGASVSAVRRLSRRMRLKYKLEGWTDRDEKGRIRCLPELELI